MSGGRYLDSVWQHFTRERLDVNSTSHFKSDRAVCNYCKKDIVALVARMKNHLVKCQPNTDNTADNFGYLDYGLFNSNEYENGENMNNITPTTSGNFQFIST